MITSGWSEFDRQFGGVAPHGSDKQYRVYKCRCELCRAGQATRAAKRKVDHAWITTIERRKTSTP